MNFFECCGGFFIRPILDIMKNVKSVNKSLQANKTTILDVQGLFVHVINSFPNSSGILLPTISIAHGLDFESGVVNVQLGQQIAVSRSERLILKGIECKCLLLLRKD